LHETERRGTAGALALLPEAPTQPLIVMNGDLLTKVNFNHLLNFHYEHHSKATMCVREYDFQVPYGVVKLDHQRILNIDEKPVQRFFVNAGIYVFDPDIFSFIPKEGYLDMPNLFDLLIKEKHETAAFPVREYWLDIGQMEDLVRANGEFSKNF
jgi:NDP-sugar pyrophosphorylase family protein